MKPSKRLRFCLSGLLSILILYVSPGLADANERVLTLNSASGAKMRTLVTGNPATATANLILLAGGDGKLILSGKGEIKRMGNNFVVRSRNLFVKKGFLTAVVDAPMDRRDKTGLLGGFRASEEHASDLASVASALKAMNGKPVVVIGTSRGTVSAANLAARQKAGTISAAVLTSSLIKKNKKGAIVQRLPLASIKVPVLFVHNRHDGCKFTQLQGVERVVAKMKALGVNTGLIIVESTRQQVKNPCVALTPHGFLGIEAAVIGKIAQWIRAQL